MRVFNSPVLRLVLVSLGMIYQSAMYAQAASITERTAGLQRQDGFIPFYWDADKASVLLEIPVFDQDVLYYVSAASGGGSVELGLDRGIMATKVVHFTRAGSKVLVEEQNLDFRALGGTVERAANVRISFPTSVLAALPIVATEGERILVDANTLFMRDAGDIELELRGSNQGSLRLDTSRSTYFVPRMKAFTDNTEIETLMTYAVDNAGVVLRTVVPDPRSMSLHIHHSFLRAPEGYIPRLADSRIGVSAFSFSNLANPVNDGTEVSWITRWRLQKQDPAAAMSPPVKPIVFYLDPAIPADIREAMRVGTLWWNEAYEAAGFINAVEVREPDPDMDPMDIRYAWVQWIERDERGFSSGGTFRDPRTGEILGSKTRMDSARIRTIANYWESYMQATTDTGMSEGQRNMVLLRQSLLVAHELGHVLGFQHNWASSMDGRASVMEYPTPRVNVVDGKLDLSESFRDGIGEYDKYMVRYAYTEITPSAEAETLASIIAAMQDDGLHFVPETDPRWAWYDDLASPVTYLQSTMAARDLMVSQYGLGNLQPGEPLGALRDMRLWMSYLHHRWAIESGQRFIGGMYHNFVNKGDTMVPTEIVPGALQREVLTLLMSAISPANMVLPEELLVLLTPHPGKNLEDMANDYAFDQLRAARILSSMVVMPLLEPARTARMVAFADRQPETLGLPELVATLLENSWSQTLDDNPRFAALQRVNQSVVLHGLMQLGADSTTSPEVRAYVLDQLARLADDTGSMRSRDPMTQAHLRQAVRDIGNYLQNPADYVPDSAMVSWGDRPRSRFPLPPGPPL